MMQSFSKSYSRFTFFSFLLLFISISATMVYFWKKGFLDENRAKNLHKASFILENYQTKNTFDQIQKLVEQEKLKQAITKVRGIEKELGFVNKHLENRQFIDLKKTLQKLKISSTNLLSYSKTSKVMEVFNTKLEKFSKYVIKNNWRTLTRMSDRVKSVSRRSQSMSGIESFVSQVNRDFKTMIRVTENSILTRKDKSEIISRIKNLQVEVTMLEKYSRDYQTFGKLFDQAKLHLKNWFRAVAPALTLAKIQVEQVGKYYIMALGGLLALVTSLALMGIAFFSWRGRKNTLLFENSVEELVTQNILAGDLVSQQYSQKFQDFCMNTSNYIYKRMSMGSIFQDSLPFGSVLLDDNLKVIWSNKQFNEDWQINDEDMNKEFMTWDFLNKLTNIGHDDPVVEALKHQVAGIYQIQVKPMEDLTARPFEMFVSPVEYDGEKRVQLFFYDLRSLEQTIKDQAQSLIRPIKESLIQLKNNEFEANEELKYDFVLAGIKDVYQQFVDTSDKLTKEKENLLDQLEIAQGEIAKYEEQTQFLLDKLSDATEVDRNNVDALKVFKEKVISLSQTARELDRSHKKGIGVINANINALNTNKIKQGQLLQLVTEISQGMPSYGHLKSDMKSIKAEYHDQSNKLNNLMKNFDSIRNDAKWSRSVEKLAELNRNVNALNQKLDKKLSQLEVGLSKADMIISSAETKVAQLATDFENQQIEIAQSELKPMRKLEAGALGNIEQDEELIIDNLHNLFKGTKSHLKISSQMRDHLSN